MKARKGEKNFGFGRRCQTGAVYRRKIGYIGESRDEMGVGLGDAVFDHMGDDVFGYSDQMFAIPEFRGVVVATEPADDVGRLVWLPLSSQGRSAPHPAMYDVGFFAIDE